MAKKLINIRGMAAALIINNDAGFKRLLLVHNTKHGLLRVEPPGGKKNLDETLEECVIREVEEELGLIIKPERLFGVYDTDSPEGKFIVSMYLSEIKGGDLTLREPDKISNYGWYTFNELLTLKKEGILVPNLCKALDDLKSYLT